MMWSEEEDDDAGLRMRITTCSWQWREFGGCCGQEEGVSESKIESESELRLVQD
jgi:hypothetical protein